MMPGRALWRTGLAAPSGEARLGVAVRAARPAPSAKRRTVVRLWLPLTPIWILLAPLALIGAPALGLARETRGLASYRTAFAIGATLLSLSGTVIDVDTPDVAVRIRIL